MKENLRNLSQQVEGGISGSGANLNNGCSPVQDLRVGSGEN